MHNSAHCNRVHPLDSNLTCDVLRYFTFKAKNKYKTAVYMLGN